jgi:serine phosphatase RsbU (regulator of sigma subunit)
MPQASPHRPHRPAAFAAVYGLLAAIFVARLLVDVSGLGIPYLAVFPIALACFLLGRTHAYIAAALGLVIFLVSQELAPVGDVGTGALVVGTIGRAAVFFGLAAVVCALLDRETALRRALEAREREVRELDGLRSALTPHELPELEGITVATSYTPAEGLVAGDFFLVAQGARDTVVVVVGDVVGHGLAAARRAAYVRATIGLFAEYTDDPMTILRLANTALAERDPGTEFVTALCAIFDASARTMTWASAGHPPPWDLDRAESIPLARPCPPLGVERMLRGEAIITDLHNGNGVLIFTDGLPEARTARDVSRHPLFGEEATARALRDLRGAPPSDVVAELSSAAVRHAGGAPADDLCLVAVRMGNARAQPQAA